MDFYQKNLKALKKVNGDLYKRLEEVATNQRYEVFTGKDPVDINILDTKAQIPLYDNPVADTQQRLEEFNEYSRYPFLFFYGIGNGIFFKALLNHPSFNHIIVTEPEIELIYIALNFADFSKDIESLRLMIIHSKDLNNSLALKLATLPEIGVYVKLYNLHITTPYYGSYEEDIKRVNGLYINGVLQSVKNHGNDAIDALIGIEHFIQNIPDMLSNPSFRKLCQSKNSSLCVCVATGPSLTKQLPLLKEMQEYVTIISVDASLPVLYKWGIRPDIVTSLERIELTKTFFERTPKAFHDGIVFAHSALQHRAVMESSFGQKVVIMRPFGYMQGFSLDEFGYAGIGMSAANLSLELAFYMGFKKMCFIGQDLAYGEDGNTHASDHTFGARDSKFEENIKNEERLIIEGYGGEKKVETNAIWLMFLNYFVQNVYEARGILECINATEGGARIEGTTEMAFADVIKNYVDTTVKKKEIVLEKDSPSKMQRNIEKAVDRITDILEYGKSLKDEVETLFIDVASACEKLVELNQENQLERLDFKKLKKLLQRIDTIKEIFNEKKFRQYFWEGLRATIINQELEIAKIVVKKADSEEEEKARDVEFIFAHKAWLYTLAGGIDAQVTVIGRAYENTFLK